MFDLEFVERLGLADEWWYVSRFTRHEPQKSGERIECGESFTNTLQVVHVPPRLFRLGWERTGLGSSCFAIHYTLTVEKSGSQRDSKRKERAVLLVFVLLVFVLLVFVLLVVFNWMLTICHLFLAFSKIVSFPTSYSCKYSHGFDTCYTRSDGWVWFWALIVGSSIELFKCVLSKTFSRWDMGAPRHSEWKRNILFVIGEMCT